MIGPPSFHGLSPRSLWVDAAAANRWILIGLCLVGAMTVLIPAIDIAAAGTLANPDGTFLYAGNAEGNALDDARGLIGYTALLTTIAVMTFAYGMSEGRFRWSVREIVFVVSAFVVNVVIVVNGGLKTYIGRARPGDVTEFGGDAIFSGPMRLADQCDANCSFVTGDGAFAFTFLAFAFIAKSDRAAAVLGALLFGLFIGWLRMAMGAHFLSDVVFAGLVSFGVIVALHRLIIRESTGTMLRDCLYPRGR